MENNFGGKYCPLMEKVISDHAMHTQLNCMLQFSSKSTLFMLQCMQGGVDKVRR